MVNKYDFMNIGIDATKAGHLINNKSRTVGVRSDFKTTHIKGVNKSNGKELDYMRTITYVNIDDVIDYYERELKNPKVAHNHKRMMPSYLSYLQLKESLDDK